ncbi:hypothetical protein FIBSPDRAFT_734698, partial [Athelia psychrophila]
YPANCHCGAFTYTVRIPSLSNHEVLRCTCSICVVNGYLMVYPKRPDVIFHTGHESLKSYTFGTKKGLHKFCPTCGSSVLIDFQGSDQLCINVRMFQDIDLETLHFKEYDGKNVR